MSYCGYVVEVKELRKHSNADRLQIATFFGNDTIVGLDTKVGDVGIYFPIDGQLSEDYCKYNDLVRRKDSSGNSAGGYLDPDKRNIKAVKLRGEKSDGLFMPLSSLDYFSHDKLNVGDKIDILNGIEVCTKYIPRSNSKSGKVREGNRTRKKTAPISPLFIEHADTEQLAYNLGAFRSGDLIEITLKMHGTSQRTGYLPVLKGFKKSLLDIILRRDGTPIYDWGYVSGTRRVVLDNFDGGFYGSNQFREQHSKFFEGKLLKGEEVYYEVVGYTNNGEPIMPKGTNSKVDKEFEKKYGKETVFDYGCEIGQSKAYVYRMTMTNEDGDMVEYPPDYMRYRCEQMGANVVPLLYRFIIHSDCADPGAWVKEIAEQYYDGADPIGKTHVREGVVCRIVNRPKFTAYKHKNWEFKVLSGIAIDNANTNMSEDILSEM